MKNKRIRVVVFGKSGLLGGEFFSYFISKKISVFGYDSKSCDITKFDQIFKIIKKIKPDIVINCSGKINIDKCEEDPVGAYMVNSIGPGNIARALKLLNKKTAFFHISTAYIFGGKASGGYKENSDVKPVNIYGWSKFLGEKIVEQELRKNSLVKYFIIRTGWMYGGFRRTFIEDIIDSLRTNKTMKLVTDNYNVPTWTGDLVRGAVALLKNKKLKSGIYHLFNSYKKPVAKYDIGVFMAGILRINTKRLEPCRYKDVSKIGKPGNTILINSKVKNLPDWKKSLARYLKLKYWNSFNLK
ncbi:MAG: sugar nucleotide-binding protein [bacterium]|nr:sugar nucleotide-binding protein [bacterium]